MSVDHQFFERVIRDSIQDDYIYPPHNWSVKWYGHELETLPVRYHDGCWICFMPCIGRGNDEVAVLIGTVFFVFSTFVAFAFAARSARSACKAHRDLQRVRNQKLALKFNSIWREVNDSSNQEDTGELKALCNDAEILLKGRRRERTWVALSQGAVTVGAALLTTALLVAFITEGELFLLGCGTVGGGMIILGGVTYTLTKCYHFRDESQEAASRICQKLYPIT